MSQGKSLTEIRNADFEKKIDFDIPIQRNGCDEHYSD